MRKFISLILSLVMCFAMALPAFAAQSTNVASEQLDAVEEALYGTKQANSMMERCESLEYDLYGEAYTERNILERIQTVYSYVCGDGNGNGSFMQRLNAVDSRFNAELTKGPAKTRIETLENNIYGASQEGTLKERMENLVGVTYEEGEIPTRSVVLPKDSLVKIEFTEALSSKEAQAGDEVSFVVADNLYVNDVLVIAKGAKGEATIAKVVQPRSFGRDARIDVNFSHVYAVDSGKVPVYIGKLAKQEAKTAAGAGAATIGGMVVLGPIGAVGGAFVKGQSLVIPEGSTTYVQVTSDTTVEGIVYQEASASADAE